MKIAKGLGLFVALALLGTACGTKGSATNAGQSFAQTTTTTNQASGTGKEAGQKGQDQANVTGNGQNQTGTQTASGQTGNGSGSGAAAKSSGNSTTGGAGGANGGTDSTGAAASGGTSAATASNAGGIELDVTQNFGQQGVFDQTVGATNGQSLLDVMRGHLDVETAYGGGFVNSINGTKSGYTGKSIFTREKKDWFYYVNGSVAAVGADQYTLHPGDEVWWDYHDWSGNGSNAPCVVGDYPHPFVGGYGGAEQNTTIYYSGAHGAAANRLAAYLNGNGAHASTEAYADSAVANPSGNVIVVGTWSELGSQAAIQTWFGAPTRTGVYAAFQNGQAVGLTYNGKATGSTGDAVIVATGTGSGDTSPVWLVIGATEAGLDEALQTLESNPSALHAKMGALLQGGSVIGVPVAQ